MTQVKLLFADKAFFAAAPKKVKAEDNEGTGRTYFMVDKRIVAVAMPEDRAQ